MKKIGMALHKFIVYPGSFVWLAHSTSRYGIANHAVYLDFWSFDAVRLIE